MKIEVLLTDDINETNLTGMICFEAPNWIHNEIAKLSRSYKGVVIINDTAVKFSFSALGCDGDIFSHDDEHRRIVKTIVPLFIYSKLDELLKKQKKG